MSIYFDSNATTEVDGRVAELVQKHLVTEYGNAGSRTHQMGLDAKKTVNQAREQIAAATDDTPDVLFFTSGATEANNLAILGLRNHILSQPNPHIITTAIEHKAVLEPIEHLEKQGADVTYIQVDERGWPDPQRLNDALKPETVLVSTMHVNNETGVEFPLRKYAEILADHPTFWHVDAAQGLGKKTGPLGNKRIDLISYSGHKLFAPKGIGALVARRRGFIRPPLEPLMFGGGQERGLRPGTLPVALIAGFGLAAELAEEEKEHRIKECLTRREEFLQAISPLQPVFNGDQERVLPHIVNVSFPGIDSEAAMIATKDLVAISNGSACTSSSMEPSHVLIAMGMGGKQASEALRVSWSHQTPSTDWSVFVERLKRF